MLSTFCDPEYAEEGEAGASGPLGSRNQVMFIPSTDLT